jgi:hypothetical protein
MSAPIFSTLEEALQAAATLIDTELDVRWQQGRLLLVIRSQFGLSRDTLGKLCETWKRGRRHLEYLCALAEAFPEPYVAEEWGWHKAVYLAAESAHLPVEDVAMACTEFSRSKVDELVAACNRLGITWAQALAMFQDKTPSAIRMTHACICPLCLGTVDDPQDKGWIRRRGGQLVTVRHGEKIIESKDGKWYRVEGQK